MFYYVHGYNFKGRPYHLAMYSAGHRPKADKAEIAFFDRDWYMHNDKRPRYQVTKHLQRGASIMIYPHSALPPWWYDGLIKIQPYVKCVFVIGEGQKAAMRVIAPEIHTEAAGWPWCPQRAYASSGAIETILFAPIHPAGGKLRPEAVQANRDIYHELKRVQSQTGCKVVVRYVGDLVQQGLHPYHRFEWVQGRSDGKTKEIDAADVVIAEGTMMYLAVARGKPTIGINQHLPCRANKMSEKYTPHNWDKYGPDLAYPINYGDAPLQELIEQAMAGEQSEWRERFIGEDMDRRTFADTAVRLHRGKYL
ncbi:MAG: hypothetical protein SVT56_04870 [Chloroflexota bacterium]|nr:hypothetical protein [Chloroflexota bacterium]